MNEHLTVTTLLGHLTVTSGAVFTVKRFRWLTGKVLVHWTMGDECGEQWMARRDVLKLSLHVKLNGDTYNYCNHG